MEYNDETYSVPTDCLADNDEKPPSSDVKLFFPGENLSNDLHNIHNVHTLDLSLAVDAGQEAIEAAKLVIDKALPECAANPAILGSVEFAEAYKIISGVPALKFEYRNKIKAAKPSGVPMADIDAMAAPDFADGDKQDTAAELIALVTEQGELFHDDQAGSGFVSVDIEGVMHTLTIGGESFTDWLSFTYYTSTKAGGAYGKSASESAIKQACFALSGIAKHEGESQRVYLRVADHNGGHYIFIGDEGLRVIEVLPTGWRILDKSPVKFWMPKSALALPMPKRGGDLSRLWEYVNIPEQDRLLVLAWMLEAFRAGTPFLILALTGQQGCAKSSTHNKIRQLIDNNAANLRSAPKNVEDIFVSAGCNWVASFENISHLSPAVQDALCTLATGGAFAARALYTNKEESVIEAKRPVIINSIPSVITAQDAVDRTINIELPRISYREESEINASWELDKPAIFGGLLDLFVKTLKRLPSVKLTDPPRMADFARLGEAMTQALGHPAGTFDALYKANRAESIGRALEASPIATAIRDMVEDSAGTSKVVFIGTMKKLLEELNKHKQDSSAWPKSPRGLGDTLRRQQPALSSLGIEIDIGKPGREGITVEIKKREYCECREHGFKEILPERKKQQPKSAANADSEVF